LKTKPIVSEYGIVLANGLREVRVTRELQDPCLPELEGLKRSLKIPSDSFIADSIRSTLYSCAGGSRRRGRRRSSGRASPRTAPTATEKNGMIGASARKRAVRRR